MRAAVRKYFIPHDGNNYHPHILHTKRAVFYCGIGLVVKVIAVLAVMALPLGAFMSSDTLLAQADKIKTLVNDVRVKNGMAVLFPAQKLSVSSQGKAEDMAENEYFSHEGTDGKTVISWLAEAGYDYNVAGENLAMGFSSAEDVVAAWKKSPTHRANLIDSEYSEFGVGIEGGEYKGTPTVFIALHAASSRKTQRENIRPLDAPSEKTSAEKPVSNERSDTPSRTQKSKKKIAGARVKEQRKTEFHREKSTVTWKARGETTRVLATAVITGPVRSAEVIINDTPIELKSSGGDMYSMEAEIPISSDELFRTIISPTITITDEKGEIQEDTIDWESIAPIQLTILQKYAYAKDARAPVFSASSWIYIGFIALFAIALLLNIFIEFRKQHPHIILQTASLIGLFVLLLKV